MQGVGFLLHLFDDDRPPARYVEVIEPEQELLIRVSDRSVSYRVLANLFKHHSENIGLTIMIVQHNSASIH